jgi:hypothetical protein
MMRALFGLTSLAGIVLAVAFAQLPVGATIPEGSALVINHDQVVFDLSRTAFPPPSFPWTFEPTAPQEPIELQLYSNLEGGWALTISFDGLFGPDGDVLLPSQVRYRLDGAGDWFALAPAVTLVSGYGVSHDYQRYLLELQLQLFGNERPGTYEGTLIFSLTKP